MNLMLEKEYICRRVLFYFVSKEDLMIINKYFKSFMNKGRIRCLKVGLEYFYSFV